MRRANKKKKSILTSQTKTLNPIASANTNLLASDHQQQQLTPKQRLLYRQLYLFKGFLGCIGGLMIHLVIGSLYQWGLLNPYYTSYFIIIGNDDLKTKNMVFVFPLMMLCIGVTMWVGLIYGSRKGYSNVCIATFSLGSLCVFISSFLSNLIGFVAFYVIGFGLCAGVAFLVPMKVCNDYFPNKQTYVNGFILIGSGLGSVFFGSFALHYLNPDQLAPIKSLFVDPSLIQIPQRVPDCIRWLSLLYFLTGTVGSLFLKPLQKFNHIQVEMEKTIISKTLVQKNKNEAGYCLNASQAIFSKIFWVNVLIIILGSCGNILMNTNYRVYADQKQYQDRFLNFVGLIGSSCNGFSRYFWSALFNKIGFKITMTIILSINILCLSTVHWTVNIQYMYMMDVMVFNITLGGMMVLAPTFSTLIFGKQVGPRVFGIFWCSFAFGNFLQYTYIMTLDDYIGIDGIIMICIGMNLTNMIVILCYKFQGPWKNDLKYFKFKILPQFQLVQDQGSLLIYSVLSNRTKAEFVSSFAYYQTQSTVYS